MTSGYLRRLHHSLGNLFVILHVQHDSSISTILLHNCKVKSKATNLLTTTAAGNTFHPYCFAINIHGHLSHLKTMLIKKALS